MAETSDIPGAFDGFRPDALQFLADLAENNERAWFQPRKAEFERLIRRPIEALCVALADRFAARGLPLIADPSRSPFRIYRDARFSKDKSPYKTAQGAQFGWQGAAPTGRTSGWRRRLLPPRAGEHLRRRRHVAPGTAGPGGLRERVDRDPAAVLAALEDERFRSVFGSVGGRHAGAQPQGLRCRPPPRRPAAPQGRRLQPAPLRCRRGQPGAAGPHRRRPGRGSAGAAAARDPGFGARRGGVVASGASVGRAVRPRGRPSVGARWPAHPRPARRRARDRCAG